MGRHAPPQDRAATLERWARIDELFHAALDRPRDERLAFLRQACGGDRSLLVEVESLLRADAPSVQQSFDRWIGAAAAEIDGTPDMNRRSGGLVGRALSHYDIAEQIGAGGMGEVYRATDRSLGRQVAIKTLPRAVQDDPRRLDRFRREARAASALSHPNVAAIYELDEADGQPFIAMEYVDGQTLDALLRDGPVPFDRAIEVVLRVADALGEAHAAGITHRDIKPANVMITSRGLVKVLDFGLAKLASEEIVEGEISAGVAPARHATSPGVIMGTIDYMSPEQVLALPVDHRTDLFSLGVLLYQLTTGELPFRRPRLTATLEAILHADAVPPSHIRPDLPRALDRVLARALAKSPADRYQLAHELAANLEVLRRGLHDSERTAPVWRRRSRLTLSSLAVAGVGALAAGIWLAWPGAGPGMPMVVPLTSFPGIESTPAFAPDGDRIAFSWDGPARDNVDIYILPAAGASPVRVTTDPAPDTNPAFSPDGTLVGFVRGRSRVLLAPAEGGPERDIGQVGDPRITFTPDGQFIAGSARISSDHDSAGIVLIPIDGGGRRALTAPPAGSIDIAPAFSPDGTRLAFQRIPTTAVSDIWVADAGGGNPARITFDDRSLEGPVWTQDGRSLVFSSGRLGAGRLWRVAATGGTPEALPDTGPGSTMPTVPRRGDRLAFVASLEDTNMWEVRLDADGAPAGPTRPGIAGSSWLDGSPDFSRDGRQLVFVSNRTGRDEIFVGDVDSVEARQLTDFSRMPASAVGSPRLSPDGRHVAFDARVRGNADIYIVGVSGSAPRRLTTHPGADVVPVWSPDGAWIYFTSRRTGRPEAWRLPMRGDGEEQVTNQGAFGAQFSHDGRFLLYGKERTNTTLWRRSIDGGREEPALVDHEGRARVVVQFAFWRPASRGIIFLEQQADGPEPRPEFVLRSYDAATGRVALLATLAAPPSLAAGGLAVSPDERRVLFTQVDARRSDINLLQPYR